MGYGDYGSWHYTPDPGMVYWDEQWAKEEERREAARIEKKYNFEHALLKREGFQTIEELLDAYHNLKKRLAKADEMNNLSSKAGSEGMFALINKTWMEYILTKYKGLSTEDVRDAIQYSSKSENVALCKDCIHHREPDRCTLHLIGGMYNPTFFCADGEE